MRLMHVTIATLLVATPATAQTLAEASAKAKAERAAKCAATPDKCQTKETPIPAPPAPTDAPSAGDSAAAKAAALLDAQIRAKDAAAKAAAEVAKRPTSPAVSGDLVVDLYKQLLLDGTIVNEDHEKRRLYINGVAWRLLDFTQKEAMVTVLKHYFYREHNWGGVYLHDSKTDYELARGTASGVTIK